jgi:hypothetical protein
MLCLTHSVRALLLLRTLFPVLALFHDYFGYLFLLNKLLSLPTFSPVLFSLNEHKLRLTCPDYLHTTTSNTCICSAGSYRSNASGACVTCSISYATCLTCIDSDLKGLPNISRGMLFRFLVHKKKARRITMRKLIPSLIINFVVLSYRIDKYASGSIQSFR